MITLKTLPQATAQEVFDQAARHLIKQGVKSEIEPGFCSYRHGVLKCVAGCFISDDEYETVMEDKCYSTLVSMEIAPKEHQKLISALQWIHDKSQVDEWVGLLRDLAESEGLVYGDYEK
jgi:hypothetical protein